MSGSTSTPLLHVDNVLGSPASSALAVGLLANTAAQLLATGVPTTVGGWVGFGVALLSAAAGLFAKAQ